MKKVAKDYMPHPETGVLLIPGQIYHVNEQSLKETISKQGGVVTVPKQNLEGQVEKDAETEKAEEIEGKDESVKLKRGRTKGAE